ncbi:hypothetical protein C8J56DRAFT_927057 [Mycena floridula]|nr:hypothetical protein C8J56DRAFT_927057 [Mycena floridula]
MTEAAASTQTSRIVPGAPPPLPLSKTQKKKRKGKGKSNGDEPSSPGPLSAPLAAAVVEKASEPEAALQNGHVAPQAQSETPIEPETSFKPSPIVELINKRLKASNKKISRIAIYASTDPEKLNEDQKRTLLTLPTLEAIQKELGEVKKTLEVHEADLALELNTKKLEAEKAEQQRIAEAVGVVEKSVAAKTHNMFALLRLRQLLATGDIPLTLEQSEATAVFGASDALLGPDDEARQAVVDGFLFGRGDLEGIPYSRLFEITTELLNPAPAPTSSEDEVAVQEEPVSEPVEEAQTDTPVAGVPMTMTSSSSFHFMQESELETFEENAEWVDHPDTQEQPHINGHAQVGSEPLQSATIDWAADGDEDALPSLQGLQAKFGSGTATPVTPVQETPEEPSMPLPLDNEVSTPVEDEGFMQARGRGRGRGNRGGDRGRARGFRGGEARGRGGFRGDYRGGDFRGGERGGRGRGEWRGDGEYRGRARGRGRGDRGVPHPPPS